MLFPLLQRMAEISGFNVIAQPHHYPGRTVPDTAHSQYFNRRHTGKSVLHRSVHLEFMVLIGIYDAVV